MLSRNRFALPLALVILLPLGTAHAQRPSVSTVNITPDEGRVRVTPVGSVFDLKIEVVDEAGDSVFEGTQASDVALDWPMTDARGARVAPGLYTVTVSYTTEAGKPRKRIEQVLVTEEVKAGGKKASASAPNPQPLVDGGGAANKLAKFTDADTLTSSSIIDLSGRVGIGTAAAPAAGLRLEVNGNTKLTPGGSGGYMQLGTPNGETGLSWAKTTSPSSRADIRFNGSALTIAAGTGVNVPPNTYGIVITTEGRVGVGTASPTIGQLNALGSANVPAVYGESPNRGVWGKSTGSSYGVYGESGSGMGVQGVSSSNIGVTGATAGPCCNVAGVVGYSTNASGLGVKGEGVTGVYGRSTVAGGLGVRGEGTTGVSGVSVGGTGVYGKSAGYAVYADGNAGQALTKGGFVKAMLRVKAYTNYPPEIGECYNSTLPDGGAGTPGCGFSVTINYKSQSECIYTINFNFQVNGRFFMGNTGWPEQGVSVTPSAQATSRDVVVKRLTGNTLTSSSAFTLIVF